jgi:hypothetical protein
MSPATRATPIATTTTCTSIEPVDAPDSGGYAERMGDRRADERGDDADQDRQQHPDGLLTGHKLVGQ